MGLRPKSESLVISALVNNADIAQAQQFGVQPEMFAARQAEYRWCLDYEKTHGRAPTADALGQKFPGFPYQSERTDVPFYIEEMIFDYNHRQLVRTIKDAAAHVSEGDLDSAIMTMGSYTAHKLAKPLPNALHQDHFLDTYYDKDDVLEFPWRTLNEITSGMRPGELYYLAARLGQGKSWLLTAIVGQALLAGRNVMFYSLEMSEQQVLTRLHVYLGAHLGFDVDHIAMRNRVWDVISYRKLVNAIKDEIPGQLFLQDTSKGIITPLTLLARQNADVDLIVVDHVGLMHTPSHGRAVEDWRAMAAISNQLKEVALAQHTRIIAAAQINREGDTTSKWPPTVKNLAQSDALGQDADTVITHKQWGRDSMCVSIEKTRDGYSKVPFWTTFEPNIGNFTEISRLDADQRKERNDDDQDQIP